MTTKQHYEQAAQALPRGELKGAFDASNDASHWANDQSPDFKQKLEADAFNYGMKDGGAGSIGQKARLNENMLTNKGRDTAEAKEQKRKDQDAHLRRMQETSDWQARMGELFNKLDKGFDAFDKDRQEAEENERAIREGLDILKNGSTDDKRQWLADPKKGKLDPNMIANMSDADIDKAFPEEIRNKINLHKEFMNGMKSDLDKIQQDIDEIRAEYEAQGYSQEQTDEAVSKYVDRLDQSGKGLTAMQERANDYGIELAEFNNMAENIKKDALEQGKYYDVLGEWKASSIKSADHRINETPRSTGSFASEFDALTDTQEKDIALGKRGFLSEKFAQEASPQVADQTPSIENEFEMLGDELSDDTPAVTTQKPPTLGMG